MKTPVSFTPWPAPPSPAFPSGPEPLCLPHTQQKACSKIPTCRRDGGAWKPQSMQTQRLFALPVQSCSQFCPTSLNLLSAASGYASTVCRFSSCSTVTFPFPGWPDLRGGGEGHTEDGWEPCGQGQPGIDSTAGRAPAETPLRNSPFESQLLQGAFPKAGPEPLPLPSRSQTHTAQQAHSHGSLETGSCSKRRKSIFFFLYYSSLPQPQPQDHQVQEY